jgi:predicted nucleic acid-binding Zn ribbon protein
MTGERPSLDGGHHQPPPKIYEWKCEDCGARAESYSPKAGSQGCWSCGGRMREQIYMGGYR